MARPRERIDTSGKDAQLKHQPLAALQARATDKDTTPARLAPTSPESRATPPAFQVQRTRKGGWPVRIENRPGGKVVTVIGNVTSGADALLRLLKKQCGAGGAVREDCIEIQGDHRARVESVLSQR